MTSHRIFEWIWQARKSRCLSIQNLLCHPNFRTCRSTFFPSYKYTRGVPRFIFTLSSLAHLLPPSATAIMPGRAHHPPATTSRTSTTIARALSRNAPVTPTVLRRPRNPLLQICKCPFFFPVVHQHLIDIHRDSPAVGLDPFEWLVENPLIAAAMPFIPNPFWCFLYTPIGSPTFASVSRLGF